MKKRTWRNGSSCGRFQIMKTKISNLDPAPFREPSRTGTLPCRSATEKPYALCKIGLLIFSTIILTLQSRATNYFVDFVGGNDASSGTSTNSAWQHCPADSKALGAAPPA